MCYHSDVITAALLGTLKNKANYSHREISQLDHRENKAYTLVTKEAISVHSNRYEKCIRFIFSIS